MAIKGTFLLMRTPRLGEFKNAKIDDGTAKIEDKRWYLDSVPHINVKTRFGTKPFYILKWDDNEPIAIELKPREPKDVNSYNKSPENLNKIWDMKILGNLMGKPRGMKALPVVMALGFGMMIMLALAYFKLLPF